MGLLRVRRKGVRVDSQRGAAFLELAIILSVFTPLLVGFVFVWLPDFSRRSTQLMNALASLGGCLVDPINLYRFSAGQPALRDDYQDIVQAAVSRCGEMSEGQTACGFVVENPDNLIYSFGLNETPALQCNSLNLQACTGMTTIPTGLVLAFMLPDGSSRCEFIKGNDPGEEPQRGDEVGGPPGPSVVCPPGSKFHEVKCDHTGGNASSQFIICCADGMAFNAFTNACTGCPTATHLCTMLGTDYCVDDVTYPPPSCPAPVNPSNPTYQYFCNPNRIACQPQNMAYYTCCPSSQSCATHAASNYMNCETALEPHAIACEQGATGIMLNSAMPVCSLRYYFSGQGIPCASQGSGDVIPSNAPTC